MAFDEQRGPRNDGWRQLYRDRRFGILLTILAVLLAGPPILLGFGLSAGWFDGLTSVLMLAAILSLCFERQQRMFALLLGIPTIFFSVSGHALPGMASNAGGMFVILKPFSERAGKPDVSASAITARLRQEFGKFGEARVAVVGAPPVEGLGTTGGFKLQVQDRRGAGLRALQGSVQSLADEGNRDPRLVGLFTGFSVTQPQLFVEADEEKAKAQKIPLQEIDATLQAFLGSFFVNDFFFQNRNWQVNIQAAPAYRQEIKDIGNLEVRNGKGDRMPLQTLIKTSYDSGPAIVNHYNLYPSAEINGNTAPGVSSGQAISIMDHLGTTYLPSTMGYQWTELTLQQILASQDLLTKLVFPLAVVFVLLVLAAQYKQPAPQWLTMDQAIKHCSEGLGIWEWASNDKGTEPDVVMACCGDVPTLETLAAVELIRKHLPELKVRVINIVNLMKLQPSSEHPHGLSDRDFDALFTKDKPIIFAFHGYPWLIHRLTYRRTNHKNLHVRGYKEEGTTTTPFDMVVLNDLDRFHLVEDVIDRLPQLGAGAAYFKQAIHEKLIEHKQYICKHGDDIPAISGWKWGAKEPAGTRRTSTEGDNV